MPKLQLPYPVPQDKAQLEAMFKELTKRKERPLYKVLFGMAECYNQMSILAYQKIEQSHNADFAAPGILCQSFSVELLLKFFIALSYPDATTFAELRKRGVNLRGHKYSQLFDRLCPPRKIDIARTFSKVTRREASVGEFRKALIAIGDEPFISWRYVYESDGFSHMDLPLFNQVCDALGLTAANEVQQRGRSDP